MMLSFSGSPKVHFDIISCKFTKFVKLPSCTFHEVIEISTSNEVSNLFIYLFEYSRLIYNYLIKDTSVTIKQYIIIRRLFEKYAH